MLKFIITEAYILYMLHNTIFYNVNISIAYISELEKSHKTKDLKKKSKLKSKKINESDEG